MEHLIADSGIQFITKEIEFNPSEPLFLRRGGTLNIPSYKLKIFLKASEYLIYCITIRI